MSFYRSTNPATGVVEAEFPTLTNSENLAAAERSAKAFEDWKSVPVQQRADIIARAAELIEENKHTLAGVATAEMGKPITQALGELEYVKAICVYYAQQGAGLMEDRELNPASGDEAKVRVTPLGPILGIMPWNHPHYQVARFVIPNLLLGNTVLIKHASNCPRSSREFTRIFHEAGVPKDVLINLFASSRDIDELIASPHVQGVSITGSEKAGSAVASAAGRYLKKVILELGGADPLIVLDSEALDRTVQLALVGRMGNAGQTCISSKRLIALDGVYDDFAKAYTAAVEGIMLGDPMQPDTFMGPLSSFAAREEILELVDDAIKHGATVLAGGKAVDGPGAYMEPTILADVTPAMRVYSEEVFGPVAVLHRAADVNHALELANDSSFGLGAVVFGKDSAVLEEMAERLDTGMVTLNGLTSTQPDLPFGGTKRSGIGRELGRHGIEEFANLKLIRTPVM